MGLSDYGSIVELSAVALISVLSGYIFKLLHNKWHEIYGVTTESILAITVILGLLSVAGYYIWTALTEVEYSLAIGTITFGSISIIHYLSHSMLPSFEAVGGVVFITVTVGTFANYVLRPDGIEL